MYNQYRYNGRVSTTHSNVVKVPHGYAALSYQKISFIDRDGTHHTHFSYATPNDDIIGLASTSEGLFIQVDCIVYQLSPYLCQPIGEFPKKGVDNLDATRDRLIINHNETDVTFYRNGKLNKLELWGKERFFHSKLYYYTIDDRNLFIYDQADFSLVKNIPTKLLNISDVKDIEQICYSTMNEELVLIRCQDSGVFSYPRECKELLDVESDYFQHLPEWDLILSTNGAYLYIFSQRYLLAKIPLNPDNALEIFRMHVDQATIFVECSEETYFFELYHLKLAILVASGLHSKGNLSAFLQENLYDPRLLCLIFSFLNLKKLHYDILHSDQ
jgi:hypothetical protein